MEHGIQLIPDFTIFYQLALFLLSIAILHFLVFKPYGKLLHLREEKTIGLKEKAHADRVQAEKYKVQYEEYMKTDRKKIQAWTDAQKSTILDEERDVIASARNQAATVIQTAKQASQKEYEKAKQALVSNVTEFASQIVTKILGRKTVINVTSGSPNKKRPETEQPVMS